MLNTIYLAGGCFWGVEAYFKSLKGVVDTTVGYANGNTINPKYEDLKAHIALPVDVDASSSNTSSVTSITFTCSMNLNFHVNDCKNQITIVDARIIVNALVM